MPVSTGKSDQSQEKHTPGSALLPAGCSALLVFGNAVLYVLLLLCPAQDVTRASARTHSKRLLLEKTDTFMTGVITHARTPRTPQPVTAFPAARRAPERTAAPGRREAEPGTGGTPATRAGSPVGEATCSVSTPGAAGPGGRAPQPGGSLSWGPATARGG